MQDNETMSENMSGGNTTNTQDPYEYLPNYDSIREQQGWDDYLAWCRKNENIAHE